MALVDYSSDDGDGNEDSDEPSDESFSPSRKRKSEQTSDPESRDPEGKKRKLRTTEAEGGAERAKEMEQEGKESLPPLPKGFHDLYAAGVRISVRDEGELHGGRRRGVGHRVGWWNGFVFLECVCSFLSFSSCFLLALWGWERGMADVWEERKETDDCRASDTS